MYPEELKNVLEELGEKPFRASQLFSWLHDKQAEEYARMTNLSKGLREKLAQKYPLTVLRAVNMQESRLDGTRKYLFALDDGNVIESVWMRYHHGNSVCISSQVGCAMGCRFCASTIGGKVRSLRTSEMLEQVYQIRKLTGERVSNVVVMGTGEPLDNYDNLVRFIRLVSSPGGLNISQRNLTVSTCGLVPEMYRLAEEGLAVTLALSLHAPNDEKRKALMPVANRYTIRQVLDACENYYRKTGRRLTFEYALAEGQNDGEQDAEELAGLISGMNCHVNLIPVNPVRERKFARSGKKVIANFQNKLEKYGINVTIRREMGSDIDGACGQLRKRYLDNQEKNV
ncbi:MAG TPA: 23S rRNA (adenine(2503)-C(2))-methyltransferase RlmN [Candidatus Scatomonas merdavium]|nr:23S rRNA (adenine(2503)-C(2))-methyltransferase RlmN [Candidatus Scatomonas merdavium]